MSIGWVAGDGCVVQMGSAVYHYAKGFIRKKDPGIYEGRKDIFGVRSIFLLNDKENVKVVEVSCVGYEKQGGR